MRAAVICLAVAGVTAPLAAQAAAYLPIFDSTLAMTVRGDSVGAIRDVVLIRDSLRLYFDSGSLYFAAPVAGRVFGAVFVGRGSVSLGPEYDLERQQLHRYLCDALTSWPIKSVALVAADTTITELRNVVSRWSGGRGDGPSGLLHRLLDHALSARDQTPYEPHLLSAVLNGDTTGYLLVRVEREVGPDLTFRYDDEIPDGLAALEDSRWGSWEYPISESPLIRYANDSEPALAPHPDVKLGSYVITANVALDHEFRATTTFRFTIVRASVRWIPWELSEPLTLDSLTEVGGGSIPYFRPSHGGFLWIRAPHAGTLTLKATYHGDLIGTYSILKEWRERFKYYTDWETYSGLPDKWYYVKGCADWYPRYDYWQETPMDITYRIPQGVQLATVGGLVDSSRSGDTVITHWRVQPTQWACFNVGKLQEEHLSDPRIPPVIVQINQDAHASLDRFLLQQEGALANVTSDVANSIAFFTDRFGPPMFPRYYATEVPFGDGQHGFSGVAYPGMIYLSNWTFQSMNESGLQEMFRSHEIAHQWWGIGVGPAGERDAWLQEGFAQFSALWYMQATLNDSTKFYQQLTDWRDALVRRGPDAPPLGIGFRVQLSDHPGDNNLIVYYKGAWVLQMLRNFMLNLRTMSEDAFTETMRDFYARFRGKKASIRDFQRVVEDHVGQSMDWFFDEWVNQSAIPTYTFSWHADPAVNGKIPLHLRVRQEHVPDDFFMPVPVEIQFAGGRHVFVRLNARGPLTDGLLTVPEAPTAVKFNPLESVLATVKTESWRQKP